jgi:thioredoxin reductase
VLLTNGSRVPENDVARLARNGIDVVTSRIGGFLHDQGQLSSVEFDSGKAIERYAVFFSATQHSRCDIAEILGCAFNRRGTVDTGTLSETNVPGVFVAGDASRDAQFVVVAAAEGVKAALAINQALQREELRP